MGNCFRKHIQLNPGSVLDRVISQASNDDDCILYKLANYKKGGELVEAYTIGGMVEVEKLIREQFGILMYKEGEGQVISRTEYLRWKFRNVKQVVIPVESTSATDPLGKWIDHKACWQMQYRGSLGETLLHLLIICDTRIHTRLARVLLKCFPKLGLDVFEGEEYLGASALHLAIAYTNNEIVHLLVEAGALVEQRAIGSFFLPKDQQRIPPSKQTDYEGLAYFGEYPLAWAACVGNESVYNLLLDKGAHPDWQDSFGNMILHMVVVTDQLGMYGYALRHPKIIASNGVLNHQGLTPLTLACRLGRASVFREMLELSSREFWRYSNHTCSAYPLNALDTIAPDGKTNWNSALFMILAGSKEEHLDMLDGGIIQKLLEEKWKTFAQRQFLKRITIAFLHLLVMSFSVYLRPKDRKKSLLAYDEALDFIRLGFELCTILSCISYVVFQQGEEIKNQGFISFLKQLPQSPPKALFLVANFTILATIPFRMLGNVEVEEILLSFSMVASWFFMMFFAGAVRLTGPFITMIFSMITGDMLTFGIIYAIFLLAFSQAFYYLYKTHPTINDLLFENYPKTWMALYQMTLGSYSYSDLSLTAYPNLAKGVFITFMILVPILLLNMLIAMMGNTYSQVIERSEKEWVKQWAKLVVSLERAVSQDLARQHIQEYSIKLGGTSAATELRGVMVIKTKNKTRAKQRKGAVSNWKHVGKVTIHALKKRGMTGEEMRLVMWGHRTSVCTPQGSTPRQQSLEVTNNPLGLTQQIGNGGLNTRIDAAVLSKLNTTEGNGITIRQSVGNLGSSLNPFGCFDESVQPIASGLIIPGSTSPVPLIGSGASSFNPKPENHNLLPTQNMEIKSVQHQQSDLTLLAQRDTSTPTQGNSSPEFLPDDLRVSKQLPKVKRRNFTMGLRPKIVIFSDRKDFIRINLDSDDSENDIFSCSRGVPSQRIKSARRVSIAGESMNLTSSRESLHGDTDNDDRGGVDNAAFVAEETTKGIMDNVSVVETSEHHTEQEEDMTEVNIIDMPEVPLISITKEAETIEKITSEMIKSKRPISGKHSGSADKEYYKKQSRRKKQEVPPPCVSEIKGMEPSPNNGITKGQQQSEAASSEKQKKRRERSSSAKQEKKSIEEKCRRPETAFIPSSAIEISNMNQLVAWEHPEDDI